MIRVFLADDHAVLRRGLQMLLEDTPDLRVVGAAADGREALQSPHLDACDVVVLDLSLPKVSGAEVLRRLRERYPALPVVILSMYPEDQHGLPLLREGASAYLSKDRPPEELIEAIRRAARGGRYLTDTLSAQAVEAPGGRGAPHDALSPRERQVFLLVAQGRAVSEVAAELNLHSSTVSNLLRRIKDKLRVETLGEVVGYAHRAGLLG